MKQTDATTLAAPGIGRGAPAWRMASRLTVAAGIALLLPAAMCTSGSDQLAATVKGACDAFEAPDRVILGRTRVDQRWINGQFEAGVSACGWKRPAPVDKAERVADQLWGKKGVSR